eukprot:4990206-Amphidinium_carterae.1
MATPVQGSAMETPSAAQDSATECALPAAPTGPDSVHATVDTVVSQPDEIVAASAPQDNPDFELEGATQTVPPHQPPPVLQDDDLPDFDAIDRVETADLPDSSPPLADVAFSTEAAHAEPVAAPVPVGDHATDPPDTGSAVAPEGPSLAKASAPQQGTVNPLPNVLGGSAFWIGGHQPGWFPEGHTPLTPEAEEQLQLLRDQVAEIVRAHRLPKAPPVSEPSTAVGDPITPSGEQPTVASHVGESTTTPQEGEPPVAHAADPVLNTGEDIQTPQTPPRSEATQPYTPQDGAGQPRTPEEARRTGKGGSSRSRAKGSGKTGGKNKSQRNAMAWSHHQRLHLPYPPEHLGRSSATQHLRWCNHIWRYRTKYGYELLGHIDEGRMQRFAHLPVAVSDEASLIASPPAHIGTTDRGRQARGKRRRSPSPTPEEVNLSGAGPATLPFGHPPTPQMLAASAASVRKEQASKSNRPRSPLKKPQRDSAEAPSPATQVPSRPAPAPHMPSEDTATGIPPPPYVRAAARRDPALCARRRL